MSEGARNVQTGTAGSNINVDVRPLDHATPKKVALTADYTLAHPAGFPTPPFMTGATYSTLRKQTQVITNGTTVALLKAEADALIAAGKATAV
jgi:hypothetical protein